MKKFLTLILSVLLAFSLTGCGQTFVKIDGLYWQNSTQGYDNTYYEELIYDVECVKSTKYNSAEISNNEIALVINDGTYKVVSKSMPDKGSGVVLVETTLYLDAKYVIKKDNSVYSELNFVEEITSSCYFVATNFKPISSSKKVKASSLGVLEGNYVIFPFEYEYNVEYSGNNAKVNFTEIKDDFNVINADAVKEYKDATKEAYLDNEMILFAPRGYNLLGNTNFSVSYTSLDVISQTTRGMYFTTMSNDNVNPSTVTMTNANGQDVEAVRVIFALTGQFTGAQIECYYASKAENKNRLMECYTSMYGDLGYLKYTLKEVK